MCSSYSTKTIENRMEKIMMFAKLNKANGKFGRNLTKDL